jgi:hypothetical protein
MANKIFFFTYSETEKESYFDYDLVVYRIDNNNPVLVGEVTKSRGSHLGESTEALLVILKAEALSKATVKDMKRDGRDNKGSDDYYLRRYFDGAAVDRFGFQIIDLRNVERLINTND